MSINEMTHKLNCLTTWKTTLKVVLTRDDALSIEAKLKAAEELAEAVMDGAGDVELQGLARDYLAAGGGE